jgi:hypothetical protein
MSIEADAAAMYLGIWPYGDPATGFTGDAYTPLFPAVVSLFDHVYLWSGWPVVVTLLSAIGTGAILAWAAYRPPVRPGRGVRVLALLEAAGLGALALSFVFGLSRDSFYEARPDHFAWLLALAGIALTARAAAGRAPLGGLAIAALTGAFWAKQTAVIAALSAVGLVLLGAWAGRLRPRRAVTWTLALAAVNGAILAALTWATDGWQYRYNFQIHLPRTRSWTDVLADLLPRSAPAWALVAALGIAAWLGAGRPGRRRPSLRAVRVWLSGLSEHGMLALGFAGLAVLGGVAGASLRRYSGGDDNNFIPCVLGLGGVCAVAYRAAVVTRVGALVAFVALLVVALTTVVPGGTWRLRRGVLVPAHHWAGLPRPVRDYAHDHLVWDPLIADLNVARQRKIEPNLFHIQEALLRGARPKAFERDLLDRRFSAIYGYPTTPDIGSDPRVQWEDGYFWKLGQVIRLKYKPDPRIPLIPGGAAFARGQPGASVPRRGPDPAPWLDSCFGPFRIAGIEMQIHRGGGLWCADAPGHLTLRGSPAPISEVASVHSLESLQGVVAVASQPRSGAGWRLECDLSWRLVGIVAPGAAGVRVTVAPPGAAQVVGSVFIARRALHRTGGEVYVRIGTGPHLGVTAAGPAQLVVRAPVASSCGKLHLWATPDSGASFDLGRLRAR